MRVFNTDKTVELTEYDLTKGYLLPDKIITHHEAETVHHEAVEGVEEVGHYETVKVYPNGGEDLEWVVEVEGVEARDAYDEVIMEAYDDVEEIEVYIPYTEEQLKKNEINALKGYLLETDYTVIKCMEKGLSVADTYPEVYQKREEARKRINELESDAV